MLSFGRDRPYIIGRDKSKVSMCINHGQISRKHAVISWKSSGWVITDHSRPNSDSGVMINGTKFVKHFKDIETLSPIILCAVATFSIFH